MALRSSCSTRDSTSTKYAADSEDSQDLFLDHPHPAGRSPDASLLSQLCDIVHDKLSKALAAITTELRQEIGHRTASLEVQIDADTT